MEPRAHCSGSREDQPDCSAGYFCGHCASDPNSLRGTDDHSQVRSTLDWSTKTVTTVLNRRGGATKVPVKVSVNRSDDSIKLTLDGQAFTNGGTADLAKDRTLVVDLGDGAPQTWTLKKVTVGNNPVLPGQYADPDIDYFDGKFWIYPTTDGFSGWSGNYFHAFSSTDLVNWTDEGVILDVNKDHQPTTDGDENTAISRGPWAPRGRRPSRRRTASTTSTTARSCRTVHPPSASPWPTTRPARTRPPTNRWSLARWKASPLDRPSTRPSSPTEHRQVVHPVRQRFARHRRTQRRHGEHQAGTVKKLNGLNGFRESVVVAYRDGKYHWTWSCDDANSPNYHVSTASPIPSTAPSPTRVCCCRRIPPRTCKVPRTSPTCM